MFFAPNILAFSITFFAKMIKTKYDCSHNDCQQTDTAEIVGRFYTVSPLLVSYGSIYVPI